jgi:predicted secreted protein
MKIAYVHTWDVRAVAKGGVAMQLRYSECKCQKAKMAVQIQRSVLVQNDAVKISYVHT